MAIFEQKMEFMKNRLLGSGFCTNLFQYNRNITHQITVGTLPIGGSASVSIQSMTTTNTLDSEASVAQVKRIIEAGADVVRLTTQGRREARNLLDIKSKLTELGYTTPLVADIHFNPNAAILAAEAVEKVRINPGNFTNGAKKFEERDLTPEEYRAELDEIKKELIPFIEVCKKYNRAIRIGTNHGSLSDRIMSKYGDTPEGMVAACMEYLHICKELDFDNIVLSIKASNTRVMVHTVRLLVKTMNENDMNFPLHLGVTEAGEGEDGRLKSAVGTGALLADGVGDTIRVSLTEAPENEIPVGRKLVSYINGRKDHEPIDEADITLYNPYSYQKRISTSIDDLGGDNLPIVIVDKRNLEETSLSQSPEFTILDSVVHPQFSEYLRIIVPYSSDIDFTKHLNLYPLFTIDDFRKNSPLKERLNFLSVTNSDLSSELLVLIKASPKTVLLLSSKNKNITADLRSAFLKLLNLKISNPVIISSYYQEDSLEDLQIKAGADLGLLFLDGFGDGILISNNGKISLRDVVNTEFGLLQASRVRFSKTEFISCPGCGRTLFDLQATTAKIKALTSHLKGLKIGIMGCIVNGPGEMADADYGYVGSGPGKITLYRQKEVVKKNLSDETAVDELINLIKNDGLWVEQ